MQRIKEEFLDKLITKVSLTGKKVLEIGCGSGSRSVKIAALCESLDAIDPDEKSIEFAEEKNSAPNITYSEGRAEHLIFNDKTFDVVIFTLSLHHVPKESMNTAIEEAVRVTKSGGEIVFLEPTHQGSFFESEINFGASDGDERMEKAHAYAVMLSNMHYKEVVEMPDETVFKLDSVDDFITTFTPDKNLERIEAFLRAHDFTLNAHRRINIFRV